jgi:hypothetical protein
MIGVERLALMDAEEIKIEKYWLLAGALKLRGIKKDLRKEDVSNVRGGGC